MAEPLENSSQRVTRVLAGELSYDALGRDEQAAVRAEWDERMTARREPGPHAAARRQRPRVGRS